MARNTSNPARGTVVQVHVPLLELSEAEEERLIQLVGPRYKERTEMLRLVSDRFPNRIDNKVRSNDPHTTLF